MYDASKVSALRVADEAFLVATTIERCPKTMMIRELFKNAVEAAIQDSPGAQTIEVRANEISGVPKLCIWNTGPGMSGQELHDICDLASSLGKEKALDQNFGMGAKVASLPSNRYGLRYRSCKGGLVSEVILGERDGVYGRVKRLLDESGMLEEVIDVSDACRNEGEYDLSLEWTEVVLFGNHAEQNTVRDPYDGDPSVTGQWLADYLYHRFYRLPAGLVVRFLPGTHKLDGTRTFRTIPDRAFPFGRYETVGTKSGIIVHYFYDPPLGTTSHNKSVSGSITTDVSLCCLVSKDEMYDVKRGRQWTLDAPIFGVPFGARHISIHIALPSGFPVLPEQYRQFLRYKDGNQQQVGVHDFADIVRDNRPQWLVDVINTFAPSDSDSPNEIREELQKLLNSLRVRASSPLLDALGQIQVASGIGRGAAPVRGGQRPTAGNGSSGASEDLLAVPSGAKRARVAQNPERAPEIIALREPSAIEEKGLKGKAAKFYPEASQLFVNMSYPAVGDMRDQLEAEYAGALDTDYMRRLAVEHAERTIILRVGRAVIFALAKQLNREWSTEDMARAQSPESLSLAADDYIDSLQNARRRMSQALRTARQEVTEPVPA
jgi:hypothetical protein